MAVEKGSKIKVEYEGRFEDGKVFDSSKFHGQPLEFTAGSGMVVRGFDNAVLGMQVGEEKEVTLQPQDAYGLKDPKAIQKVPRKMLPQGIEKGMEIGIPLPDGQVYPAYIADMDNDFVTIDLGHPMAGKVLIFKIKVVEVSK